MFPITRLSSGGPKPNGLSTRPIPNESFLVTTLSRIVIASPPTFSTPPPDGSSCRASSSGGGGGNGFGRLFALTTLRSITAFSVDEVGRPGSTTTRIAVVLPVSLFPTTKESVVFSNSIPSTASLSLFFFTAMSSSMPT